MIIDNFHIERVALAPHETDAPLIVDTYAVLSLPLPAQSLQPVAHAPSPALRPVTQQVVGQDASHHRFADRQVSNYLFFFTISCVINRKREFAIDRPRNQQFGLEKTEI